MRLINSLAEKDQKLDLRNKIEDSEQRRSSYLEQLRKKQASAREKERDVISKHQAILKQKTDNVKKAD